MARSVRMDDSGMLCVALQRRTCAGSAGACCQGVDPAGQGGGLSVQRIQKIRTAELLRAAAVLLLLFCCFSPQNQAALAPFQEASKHPYEMSLPQIEQCLIKGHRTASKRPVVHGQVEGMLSSAAPLLCNARHCSCMWDRCALQ